MVASFILFLLAFTHEEEEGSPIMPREEFQQSVRQKVV